MDFTQSIDFTMTKEGPLERMDFTEACLGEAAGRVQGSITTERIAKEDEILGTYIVESDAIPGGMGSVWRVRHTGWDVELAMKRPHPRFFAEAGPRHKKAFIAECEHWIKLGLHPNIVSCYYVREVGGVPTVFSEWMGQGSLKDAIASGALYEDEGEAAERILDIAIQSARGLAFSHERNLLHQDVKPGNLLIADGWEVKVSDFGLARAASDLVQSQEQKDDPWAGLFAQAMDGLGMYADAPAPALKAYTPAYCPREQAEGAGAEEWMDLYAWALCVLEMYLGEIGWESGAQAPEAIDGLTGRLRVSPPAGMIDFLKDCLASRGEITFQDAVGRCERFYEKLTGRRYSRSDAREAMSSAETLNNYALSFLDLGLGDKALELWDMAAQADSSCVSAAYNRTLYSYRTGLLDDVSSVAEMRSLAYSGEGKLEAFLALARIQHECRDAQLPETLDKIEELFGELDMPELQVMREDVEKNRLVEVYRYNNSGMGPVDVSPDGSYLLLHDSDGGRSTETLVFCDIDDQEEISRMVREPDEEPHAEVRAQLSRDNRYAFGMYMQDPFLYRWRTSDGKQMEATVMRKLPGEEICAFDVDASGERILTASTRGCVTFVRPGLMESKPFGDFNGHFGVGISADGLRGLVFCQEENRVVIRDDEGKGVEIPVGQPSFARFALDDSCVIVISGELPPTIRLYDATTGARRYEVPFPRFDEFMGRQGQSSISLDGRRLLLRGHKGYLLFDIEAHRWLMTLTEKHIGEQTNLIFRSFLPGTGTHVYQTSFLSSMKGFKLPDFTEDSPWSLSFIHTAKESLEEEEAFEGFVVWAEDALDAGDVPTALDCAAKAAEVGEGRFRSSELYTQLVRALMPHCAISSVGTPLLIERMPVSTAPVVALAPSPDGRLMATLSQEGELAVVNVREGCVVYRDVARKHAHLKKPQWSGATLYSLVIAGTGDLSEEGESRPFKLSDLAGGTIDMGIKYRGTDLGKVACGQVFAFDLSGVAEDGGALDEDPAEPAFAAQDVTDFQVMRGGMEFLCRKHDGSVVRISTDGGEKSLMARGEEYQISGSALSSNERVAVISLGDIMNFAKAETCSSKVIFFDANSGKVLFTATDAGITTACAFTDDGRFALIGNELFDFKTGARVSFVFDNSPFSAFLESRFSVALGSDGSLKVHDLISKEPVITVEVDDNPTAVACSPDNTFLYIGNSKGQMATWLWDHALEAK